MCWLASAHLKARIDVQLFTLIGAASAVILQIGHCHRYDAGGMDAQAAYVVHVGAQQINVLCIVFGDCEDRDKAVGRECHQLIFEQANEHDRRGHCDDARKAIVQLRVLWIDANLVALLHETVAAHYDEVVPPQQPARHDKVLFLSLVPEQLPFARDQRVHGDAGASGHRNISAIITDRTELLANKGRLVDSVSAVEVDSSGTVALTRIGQFVAIYATGNWTTIQCLLSDKMLVTCKDLPTS